MIASFIWTICIIISIGHLEADDFIVVKAENPTAGRDIYLIPLNDPAGIIATEVHDAPADAMPSGVIYNSLTRAIVWAYGTIIKSKSVDDNSESQLVDLSTGPINLYRVTDLALDTNTGNIYVVGNRGVSSGSPARKGLVVMIDTGGTATEVSGLTDETYADMALDTLNGFMITTIRRGAYYDIVRSNFDGTNASPLKSNFLLFLFLAVDMLGQSVFWSDGSTIRKLDYFGVNPETVYYEDSLIKDLKVVGDFIYYVKTASQGIHKVNRLNASELARIDPVNGVNYMYWLDVYIATETVCNRTIPNGEMAGTCSVHVGDSCNNFTCNYGFQEQDGVEPFNCTESGNWDYNVSILCIEIFCNRTIPNGELDGACAVKVGDSCNNFTCDSRFHEKAGVDPINCTEFGTWDYNVSSLCIENQCNRTIPHGVVADVCGVNIGDSCDNFTCDYGFHVNADIVDVVIYNCTESGTWDYNMSSLCIETVCNRTIPNGELAGSCGVNVGNSCSNFTCDKGYKEDLDAELINCTESGTWDYNISSLCTDILCERSIPNGNLSDSCDVAIGDFCNTFTCDYGFNETDSVLPFNCSDSGIWNYNLSALCIEILCPSNFTTGEVSDNCGLSVGDLCENVTCTYGFRTVGPIAAFECTEAGTWNYSLSTMCTEILCPTEFQNGNLSSNCSTTVGDSCDSFNCDYGFHKKGGVDAFNCTESGFWDFNMSSLCIETMCDRHIPNGNFSTSCGLHVGASCDNFTCDVGFSEVQTAATLTCTATGNWDYNVSSLCTASNSTCPPSDSSIFGGICDDDCTVNTCESGKICCYSDICSSVVCVLPEGTTVTGACPYSATLTGICGTAQYCAVHNDCTNSSLVCCYSDECGDKVCVLPQNTTSNTVTVCDHAIPNGNLSDTCGVNVGDSCDNFTCASGFKTNENVTQFSCTEDGTWDFDVSSLCIEILCSGDILHGALPSTCNSKAGETCDGFTCDVGYKKHTGGTGLECSDTGIWSSNLSSLCVEVFCPSNITNGQVSDNCSTSVNATCDTVTCDQGHTKNTDVVSMVCNVNGTWDYQISFQCENMPSAINCRITPPNSTAIRDWIEEIGAVCNYTICSVMYTTVSMDDSPLCMSDANWGMYNTVRCSASVCSGGNSNTHDQQKAMSLVLGIGSIVFNLFVYTLNSKEK